MRSIHKDAKTFAVLGEMQAGVKGTYKEWAKRYNVSYQGIQSIFRSLRKHGYDFRPYRKSMIVGGKTKIGVIVDYAKREEWSSSCLHSYEVNYVIPHLDSAVRMLENVVENQPSLIGMAEDYSDRLADVARSARKAVRAKQ